MIYAAFGIPLALTMFQSIGERVNTFLAFSLSRMKRLLGMKNQEVSASNVVVMGLLSMAVTCCSGAFIFRYYEEWSYFTSLYYCFITLTTVGFGDLVALQESDDFKFSDTYVGISLLFIFFGLTIVGSVMNQLALRLLTIQTKEPTDNLIQGGPRCEKCSTTQQGYEPFETTGDYSTTLLRDYEEQITFTTYKALNRKRASI